MLNKCRMGIWLHVPSSFENMYVYIYIYIYTYIYIPYIYIICIYIVHSCFQDKLRTCEITFTSRQT